MGKKLVQSTVHVLKGSHGSLLSYKKAHSLGLVDVYINQIQEHTHMSDELIQQHSKMFYGIGKLKFSSTSMTLLHQLHNQPVASLFTFGNKYPWVSPLVIIPKKNGDIRLCVDMRMANRAIRRTRHPTLTVDDLIHKLNGATVFSKLDLKAGYHQIPLADESHYITTFVTHKGLRCYARLNFGQRNISRHHQ